MRLDQNPALVHLASLESRHSHRTMRGALEKIVGMLAEGSGAVSFTWAQVRYQHLIALRSKLHESMSYPTANKHLPAVRRVAKRVLATGTDRRGNIPAERRCGQPERRDAAGRARHIPRRDRVADGCLRKGRHTGWGTRCGDLWYPVGLWPTSVRAGYAGSGRLRPRDWGAGGPWQEEQRAARVRHKWSSGRTHRLDRDPRGSAWGTLPADPSRRVPYVLM